MRRAIYLCALLAGPQALQAEELKSREIDKILYDVLKDNHNRGADLYNAGESAACQAYFEGTLRTARAIMVHRPSEQKFVDEALARSLLLPTSSQRAFALHEAIERLRKTLQSTPSATTPEIIKVLPRPATTEMKKINVPKTPENGIQGLVLLNGQSLAGVQVTLVSRGSLNLKVYEALTASDGRYLIEKIIPGRYTVLLVASPMSMYQLPARYITTDRSPLIVEVRAGERLDLLLK